MALQYIQDKEGKTTGVIIPIEEWQALKSKYSELNKDFDNSPDLTSWQKEILDDRLSDYYSDPDNVNDFEETLKNIESEP
ncbi:addiction module protein [Algoriphagus yeomjeoni]|uniref:Putative addiction module component n=1 Tax=Algoriphagus yeomjeoni TaxID=291403 RepID=A0A327P2S7_9BACT|nr:addiction module protein [Algoriphagus yeomjeoni]RAI85983.1 putative addiction module component [Algoriphagus yeomjeoni]